MSIKFKWQILIAETNKNEYNIEWSLGIDLRIDFQIDYLKESGEW